MKSIIKDMAIHQDQNSKEVILHLTKAIELVKQDNFRGIILIQTTTPINKINDNIQTYVTNVKASDEDFFTAVRNIFRSYEDSKKERGNPDL